MHLTDVNLNKIELIESAGTARQLLRDRRPQVCFSGRSNAGKSSLLNALLDRKSVV